MSIPNTNYELAITRPAPHTANAAVSAIPQPVNTQTILYIDKTKVDTLFNSTKDTTQNHAYIYRYIVSHVKLGTPCSKNALVTAGKFGHFYIGTAFGIQYIFDTC